MKDAIIDLVYNWKHAMSSENTKGTRFFCIFIFVLCVVLVVTGIGGLVAGIITHRLIGVISGIISIGFGIGIFAFVSTR